MSNFFICLFNSLFKITGVLWIFTCFLFLTLDSKELNELSAYHIHQYDFQFFISSFAMSLFIAFFKTIILRSD